MRIILLVTSLIGLAAPASGQNRQVLERAVHATSFPSVFDGWVASRSSRIEAADAIVPAAVGVLGGAIGAAVGGALALQVSGCRDLGGGCEGAFIAGLFLGETLGVATGIHAGNRGRGKYLLTLGTVFLVPVGLAAASSGISYEAIPVIVLAQLAAGLVVELAFSN